MRRTFRNLSSLLLALVMVVSLAVPAFANGTGSTITAKYNKDKPFSFQVVSKYHATDLFDGFKDVMPGDRLTETVTIKNAVWNHDYIKVYMKAVPHDETDNPLAYNKDTAKAQGKKDETVATMEDFLSQLTMRVYDKNGKLIYEESPDQLDGLKKNVYLGTLRRNKSMTLTVELDVPITLGNEYANRVGEVDWEFTVEARNDPSDTPKTGDYIITGAVALMVVSAAALVILLVQKKRRK